MSAGNTKLVIKHQSWIECDTCGRKSEANLEGIGAARKKAEQAGWLVSWPAGRRRGMPDYCPDDRPADEITCAVTDTGAHCGLDAQYMFSSDGTDFPVCGKHQARVMKNLFNNDPGLKLTVRRLREGYLRRSGAGV